MGCGEVRRVAAPRWAPERAPETRGPTPRPSLIHARGIRSSLNSGTRPLLPRLSRRVRPATGIEPARRIALPSCAPPVPFRHELPAGPDRLSRIASQDRAVDEGGALRPDVARRRGALVAEAVGKRWIVRTLCRDLPRPPIMLAHATILAPDGRRKRLPPSRPRRAAPGSRRGPAGRLGRVTSELPQGILSPAMADPFDLERARQRGESDALRGVGDK